MALPSDLLQAVSAPSGGKLSLVLGAGCSYEPPTSLPLARACSFHLHQQLVADGVLAQGDCSDPEDLSAVADAVFAKTGSQGDLVARFREQYNLKSPTPNEGYRIAAALLCEHAVASIVTLNFDLALSHAISEVGVGDEIGVIESPDEFPTQRLVNIYYLHRNVNSRNPDAWVLRTAALRDEWKRHWEPIVATRALSAPVVVFAGLGTPVAVLIESATLLRDAVPGAKHFQVDPGTMAQSAFSVALKLDPSCYIPLAWCQFMEELSQRLVQEHTGRLRAAIAQHRDEEHLDSEDVEPLLARLLQGGLVGLGQLRARWLLYGKRYRRFAPEDLKLFADLLLGIAMIARHSNTSAIISADGLVEFVREGRATAAYFVASGSGHRGRAGIEAAIARSRREHRGRQAAPRGVLVAGTTDPWSTPVTPPVDVVGSDSSDDIVSGAAAFSLHHIGELRADPTRIQQVVP